MNLLVKVTHIFRLIPVCLQTVPILHRQIFRLALWLFSAVSASQSKSAAEAAAIRAKNSAKRAEDIASAVALEDADTTRKGIVQLSSATNSTSETLAATPKAVKVVMDETNRKAHWTVRH